ncbi:site-specific integrase [Acidimicrobiia bacterium EGI L10123]|uniref:tyrosine-type recombinase/integrase n=1 Tax=Salinilacustrithrix flava TaxID=2957203 RepID=UPI003D7C2E43|nr:site-specific integrase [Acidimicrobiia bacterium EGI L10123]
MAGKPRSQRDPYGVSINARHEVWFRKPDGKRAVVRCKTRSEAERVAGDKRAEAAALAASSQAGAELGHQTIRDVTEAWLDSLDGPEGTLRQYRSEADTLLVAYLARMPCYKATPQVWREWTAKVTTNHGPRRLDAAQRLLNNVTSFGQENGYWPADTDPWGTASARRPTLKRARKQAPKNGAYRRLCPRLADVEMLAEACAAREGVWLERFVWAQAGTGCRHAELLGARWDQVDLDAETIWIPHQANRYQPWPALAPVKGASEIPDKARTAPLLTCAVTALREQHAVTGDQQWVFPPTSEQRRWVDASSKATERARDGLGQWDPQTGAWTGHWLRHWYAVTMLDPLDAGGEAAPLPDVSAWLGHERLSTTQDYYVNTREDSARALIERRRARQ